MSAKSIQIEDGLSGGRHVAEVTANRELRVTGTLTSAGDQEVVQPTHDDLNANVNLQVGDVDVSGANPVPVTGTLTIGSLAIGDAVSATENVTALGLQRDDTLTTLSDPDGDAQIGRCNSRGALWVALDGTSSIDVTQATHDSLNANVNLQVGDVDVSGGNPVPVTGTLSIGTLAIGDAVSATENVVAMGLQRDDVLATLSDPDGDAQIGRVNARGALWVAHDGALDVSDGGGSLTVDGAVSVSNFPASQTVDDGGGSLTVDDGGVPLDVNIASQSADVSIDDGGNSITVDGTVTAVIAEPLEVDTAARVDSIAGGTDPVFAAGAVRDDALAALTPADGDYTNLRVSSRGALWVAHDGDVTIADGGNSITIDGAVSVSNFPASQTVDDGGGSLTVDFAQPVSVDDNGGSLTVDGTVAVSAVAGTVVVGDGGGSLTVDGTVTAEVPTVLAAQAVGAGDELYPVSMTIDSSLSSLGATDGQYARPRGNSRGALFVSGDARRDQAAALTDWTMPAGVIRDDTLTTLTEADGDYTTLRVSANGSLWCDAFIQPFTFPIDIDEILTTVSIAPTSPYVARDGDAVSFSGDNHVTVGVERDDGLDNMDAGVADGDWTHLRVDSEGALWVRQKGDIVTTHVLSGSTDGAPIQVTATTLGTPTTIHTASSTAVDVVTLQASNVGSAAIVLTVATSDGGANSEIDYIVMPQNTVDLGTFTLEDSEVLIAYASVANNVRIFGKVERHA